MPTRWFVPIPGLDPTRVKLEHVHAVATGWFDRTLLEHRAGEKPYAVSPPTRDDRGIPGVEVVTMTEEAGARLAAATAGHPEIRLGNQWRRLGVPHLVHHDDWESLAAPGAMTAWRIDLATPTTFRCGNRSSPLPSVESLTRGAGTAWERWSCMPLPDGGGKTLWVSDLDLRSDVVPLVVKGADGAPRQVVISASVGWLVVRHDPADQAASALVRTTAYSGVGGMTLKGLGVARVTALGGRHAHAG